MSSTEPDTGCVPIRLPELGADDQPICFAQWLVHHGDPVFEHDRIAEVLVGGILFHVTAPAEGIVHHAIETDGAQLRAGDSLGSIQTAACSEDV